MNACRPILVKLSGNVIVARLIQSLKVQSPIESSFCGKEMEVSEVHLSKVESASNVTESGIFTDIMVLL